MAKLSCELGFGPLVHAQINAETRKTKNKKTEILGNILVIEVYCMGLTSETWLVKIKAGQRQFSKYLAQNYRAHFVQNAIVKAHQWINSFVFACGPQCHAHSHTRSHVPPADPQSKPLPPQASKARPFPVSARPPPQFCQTARQNVSHNVRQNFGHNVSQKLAQNLTQKACQNIAQTLSKTSPETSIKTSPKTSPKTLPKTLPKTSAKTPAKTLAKTLPKMSSPIQG